MIVKAALKSAVLACALLAGTAPVQVAAQQLTQEQQLVRARLFQIYLKAEHAIGGILNGQSAFNAAKAEGNRAGMTDAMGAMLSNSSEAAYWATILDQRVNETPNASDRAKGLTGDLRAQSAEVYQSMTVMASSDDVDEMSARLDESADGLNRLYLTVRDIYALVQESIRANQ